MANVNVNPSGLKRFKNGASSFVSKTCPTYWTNVIPYFLLFFWLAYHAFHYWAKNKSSSAMVKAISALVVAAFVIMHHFAGTRWLCASKFYAPSVIYNLLSIPGLFIVCLIIGIATAGAYVVDNSETMLLSNDDEAAQLGDRGTGIR